MSGGRALPFWLVLLFLAALSAAGVYLLTIEGAGALSLLFLLVPGGIGVWYLLATRPAPAPPTSTSAGSLAEETEPFDDPVELAVRVDRGEVAAEPSESAAALEPENPDSPKRTS